MINTRITPVTVADVFALAAVINATRCKRNVRVRRLVGSDVVEGVARHLVTDPDRMGFPGDGDDLRDCYLRVSGTFDYVWPVRELISEFADGLFVIDDSDD